MEARRARQEEALMYKLRSIMVFLVAYSFNSSASAGGAGKYVFDGTYTGLPGDINETDTITGLGAAGTLSDPPYYLASWTGAVTPSTGIGAGLGGTIAGHDTIYYQGVKQFPLSGYIFVSTESPKTATFGLELTGPDPDTGGFDGLSTMNFPYNSVIAHAVQLKTVLSDTAIQATFTPNYSLSLQSAAALGSFTEFDWVQQVVVDPYPPKMANGSAPSVPYFDPPEGGYLGQPSTAGDFPYYFNPTTISTETFSVNGVTHPVETGTSLSFIDQPEEPKLQSGQYLEFVTSLVGICSQYTPGCTELPDDQMAIDLYSFVWKDNFTGTTGSIGVSSRDNLGDYTDPGYGYGGISVLSTSYPLGGAPIPEPSTWAMMLLGSAGLGYVGYRRRGAFSAH
jgi:hypothetical protein